MLQRCRTNAKRTVDGRTEEEKVEEKKGDVYLYTSSTLRLPGHDYGCPRSSSDNIFYDRTCRIIIIIIHRYAYTRRHHRIYIYIYELQPDNAHRIISCTVYTLYVIMRVKYITIIRIGIRSILFTKQPFCVYFSFFFFIPFSRSLPDKRRDRIIISSTYLLRYYL